MHTKLIIIIFFLSVANENQVATFRSHLVDAKRGFAFLILAWFTSPL